MIEDKIALALKDIGKLKIELKDVRKDMKQMEKIEDEEYQEIKKTFKDLQLQKKDLEEQWKLSLAKDQEYQKLREMKVEKEEEVAEANQKLFALIGELPAKAASWNVELEDGPVRVQVQPEMRLYLNGKEEKKRA